LRAVGKQPQFDDRCRNISHTLAPLQEPGEGAPTTSSACRNDAAPCRSERTAKYNRLLAIAESLGERARYLDPFRS